MPSLHPDLENHFDSEDGLLHHPLLIRPLDHSQFQRANSEYLSIRSKAELALQSKDWESYVFLHARPYRVNTLLHCHSIGLRESAFWKLVGKVWCDSENIFQNSDHWWEIWLSLEPGRTAVMEMEEADFLEKLETLTVVWRGSVHRDCSNALSWTTDRDTALYFGERSTRDDEAYLLSKGVVRRSDIFAAFLRRNECELVCGKVTISEVQQITR